MSVFMSFIFIFVTVIDFLSHFELVSEINVGITSRGTFKMLLDKEGKITSTHT